MWFKSIQSWTCTLHAVLPHLEPLGFKSGYDSEWKLYLRLWQHWRWWKHSSSRKNSSYHIIIVSRISDSMNLVNLTVAGNRKTGESLICDVVSNVRFLRWDTEISAVSVFRFSAIPRILAIPAMGWVAVYIWPHWMTIIRWGAGDLCWRCEHRMNPPSRVWTNLGQ